MCMKSKVCEPSLQLAWDSGRGHVQGLSACMKFFRVACSRISKADLRVMDVLQ